MFLGIDHTAIVVDDTDASLRFYRDTLGLTVAGDDIAHWQTTLSADGLDSLVSLARDHRLSLVSPGTVETATSALGFGIASLTRDPMATAFASSASERRVRQRRDRIFSRLASETDCPRPPPVLPCRRLLE